MSQVTADLADKFGLPGQISSGPDRLIWPSQKFPTVDEASCPRLYPYMGSSESGVFWDFRRDAIFAMWVFACYHFLAASGCD